jgi:hypothetical protein
MPKRSLRTKRIRRNVRKNTLRRNTLRKKNIRRKNMKRNNLRRKRTVRRNKYKGGQVDFIGTSGITLSKEEQDKIVHSAMKGTNPPIANNTTRTHKFDYVASRAAEREADAAAGDTGFTVEEEIVPEPSKLDRVKRLASYPLRLVNRRLSDDDPRLGVMGWGMAANAVSSVI